VGGEWRLGSSGVESSAHHLVHTPSPSGAAADRAATRRAQHSACHPDVLNTVHASRRASAPLSSRGRCAGAAPPPVVHPLLHSPHASVHAVCACGTRRSPPPPCGRSPCDLPADLHAERAATTPTPPKNKAVSRPTLSPDRRAGGATSAHARPLVCSCALSAATHRPSPQTPSPQTPESADARGGGANAEGARPSRKRRGRRPRVQTPWA